MLRFTAVLFLAAAVLGDIPTVPFRGSKIRHDPRIILGGDAPAGQFPYIVSLNYASTGSHACGASVITPSSVLTAAHCCQAGELYVYAGSQKLSAGGAKYTIKEMIVHEKYVGGSNYYQNDICLIKLASPLPISSTIAQVPLPAATSTIADGSLVTIVGWGYTTTVNQQVPDVLQIGKNYVAMSNTKCATESGVPAFAGEVCAHGAGTGQGVCNGDSGSPLTQDGTQVGIASFILTPCGSAAPDFYVRVSSYIGWLQGKLGADAENLLIKG